MTSITVHHLNQSRSQRILWLLEELGLTYEVVRYQRDPGTMLAPPEHKRIHPLGKSPVVTLDGEVLAESGAIRLVCRQGLQRGRHPDELPRAGRAGAGRAAPAGRAALTHPLHRCRCPAHPRGGAPALRDRATDNWPGRWPG